MELVYHEKQDGLLCGQHCLNNLLQGQYFTAVDLADIAQQMDQAEQSHMAELGMHTDEFRRFMEQPSVNMDDSGMFSVQVLTSALRVWDLTLVPYASTNALARAARDNPIEQQAYICNFKEHWLTVRKLGHQWFNLNSLLSQPELISNTYLALFLTQLMHEGYSIFVVDGKLPPSEADETLRLHPAQQTTKPRLLSEVSDERNNSNEDSDLKAALAASLANVASSQGEPSHVEGHDDLQAAIQMSLQKASTLHKPHTPTEDDDLERALQLSLSTESEKNSPSDHSAGYSSTKNQLPHSHHSPEAAASSTHDEPDVEEIRKRRLAFLSKQKTP
ncbi:ataxin-3-like isoform X2 [Homarus americanus]|uniref:ataxin-3-like isoform X2 n=1 Tax=Homarus americanus TaxID=6706 RepID=UPI001C482257|nr:ataxin-3-like isoform X2 [Homarus americanus]